ncbi:hypothetical protein [Mesomycoplasma lagogenitalium]|uniref:Restriction endonuclease type IV Mrr domain-containing protein n=1 Tax=Mesomycoplasma lagogenitalium TaxID=171286 RepID=A0ABY8LU04_9BACT|nr:hypothetical protein [Mesomycoplasma lagogenitalium]WGI36722.1 hypothetical protein QEG99_00330 [Mesomycoplasma lagogenitalium]
MDTYKKIIKEIWKYERNKLKEEIKKNGIPLWMEEKVKKNIERTFLEKKYEEIIKKSLIQGDEIILSFFMKDPKRQNIYENIFRKEIESAGFVIEKLKPSGKNAYYLIDDEIISNLKNKPNGQKSLDFCINYKNKKIFIVNKYTNESGGAQDNQYNDVIIQMKNLGKKTKDNVWFCLDGKYYTKKKIDNLKKINSDAIIVNLSSIKSKLKDL